MLKSLIVISLVSIDKQKYKYVTKLKNFITLRFIEIPNSNFYKCKSTEYKIWTPVQPIKIIYRLICINIKCSNQSSDTAFTLM